MVTKSEVPAKSEAFCKSLTCWVLDQDDACDDDIEQVVKQVKQNCEEWLYTRKVLS